MCVGGGGGVPQCVCACGVNCSAPDRGFKNTALDFPTPLTHTHTCDFSQQHSVHRECGAFVVYLEILV